MTGSAAHLRVEVPDAELWWPRVHGEQPLYDIEVRLAGGVPDGRSDSIETGRSPPIARSRATSGALHARTAGSRAWRILFDRRG